MKEGLDSKQSTSELLKDVRRRNMADSILALCSLQLTPTSAMLRGVILKTYLENGRRKFAELSTADINR